MKSVIQSSAALVALYAALVSANAFAMPVFAEFKGKLGDPPFIKFDPPGPVLPHWPPSPVPEADTSALMLAGLGLVGYVVRRRRNL